jgi:hypothetical protein
MSYSLKKKNTGASQSSEASATMENAISENVVVLEKVFKTKQGHTEAITCLTKISDSEFMTCSLDKSFKIWDKDL